MKACIYFHKQNIAEMLLDSTLIAHVTVHADVNSAISHLK